MPMILGGSGTINTSSSLAVAVAGVEDLRIDASGNTRFLSNATFFKTDGNPGRGSKIFLAGSDNGDQWIGAGQNTAYWMEYSGNPNEGHVFRTGSAERIVISGSNSNGKVPANSISLNPFSAGYVLMPNQPAWVAYGSSESWYNSVGVVPFNNANYTRNCSYDTINSRFTAPISGLYNISWSFLAGTNGNAGHISLRKNAAYIIEVMHGQSSAAEYDYTGGSMPVYLASGDYVDMYMSATFSSGIYMGSNAGRYAVFAGFLIG